MRAEILQRMAAGVWALAARQHGVVARWQLLELGFSYKAIRHRVAKGRLHPVWHGVYAVGRPELTQRGYWTAAVLTCGRGAALSHESAAALWEIRGVRGRRIDVSVPLRTRISRPGIAVHRRAALGADDLRRHDGIPVTSPVCTLVDIAPDLERGELEAAMGEADKRGLVTPEQLRLDLDRLHRRPGIAVVREALDRRTFVLTDSELERLFLPIARRAGLPLPLTRARVNGFKVDFYWPALGLVVETDGLRYHRTPAQQTKDRIRDQAHTAAGLTPLRFTHAQIRFDATQVGSTLAAVAGRLRAGTDPIPRLDSDAPWWA